jgi:hypothetical protein
VSVEPFHLFRYLGSSVPVQRTRGATLALPAGLGAGPRAHPVWSLEPANVLKKPTRSNDAATQAEFSYAQS